MPVYKGSAEVTSGNLHKGSTEVENGYKGADVFYLNETTVSWATPVVSGLTISTPSPQSSSGSPGATFTTTTFNISSATANTRLSGTATVSGLPSGLTSSQVYNNTNPGNTLTITITGTFPATSYLNVVLSISGINSQLYTLPNLSFTGPTSITRGNNITGFAFNWTGGGKGILYYGGFYPNNPSGRVDFHDGVAIFVSNQGNNADMGSSPQSQGIFGPYAVNSTMSSAPKYPTFTQYYGVNGTINNGSGAPSNSGNFSLENGIYFAASWTGTTTTTFSVLQDNTNYYLPQSISITTTVT